MELLKAGKMTIKIFKIVEPLLQQQSLIVIKKFKADLHETQVKIPRDVLNALDALVRAKLTYELKQRKLNAMFLF